ncbi:hypothetical protein JZ751_019398 [Albula glossodonta]|uniref:Uncharacterized protein n=1 Tax=Albula glossodonta TaxID=121402 RepID=A0A8T2NNU9_9TELE|nr:hypothetical protein JZ751_019398 [Albula glossodonta]
MTFRRLVSVLVSEKTKEKAPGYGGLSEVDCFRILRLKRCPSERWTHRNKQSSEMGQLQREGWGRELQMDLCQKWEIVLNLKRHSRPGQSMIEVSQKLGFAYVNGSSANQVGHPHDRRASSLRPQLPCFGESTRMHISHPALSMAIKRGRVLHEGHVRVYGEATGDSPHSALPSHPHRHGLHKVFASPSEAFRFAVRLRLCTPGHLLVRSRRVTGTHQGGRLVLINMQHGWLTSQSSLQLLRRQPEEWRLNRL